MGDRKAVPELESQEEVLDVKVSRGAPRQFMEGLPAGCYGNQASCCYGVGLRSCYGFPLPPTRLKAKPATPLL